VVNDARLVGVASIIDIMLLTVSNDPRIDLARYNEINCPCCGAAKVTYHSPTCGFSRR
jgi:hypothetical protein